MTDDADLWGQSQPPRLRSAVPHAGAHPVRTHAHANSELIFVDKGQIGVRVGERFLAASPGQMYVIPHGVAHDQSSAGEWKTRCLLYDGGPAFAEACVVDLRTDYAAQRWIADLFDHQAPTDLGANTAATGAIWNGLLAAILAAAESALRRERAPARHPALERALRRLHAHPEAPISNDALAEAAGVSTRYLTAVFRAEFGIAPQRYQQRLRMELACRLLRNPYATIAECAAAAGYEDENYFCRQFRKAHGVPPGEWRRRNVG